jgi:hypothetical protein
MSDAAAGAPTDGQGPDDKTGGHRRLLVTVAALLVAVVALVAYAWPAVARSSDRVDVVLAGDGFVHSSQQALERHLRERGLAVSSLVAEASSLCAVRDQLTEMAHRQHPAVVVLSFRRAEGSCRGVDAASDPTLALYDDVLSDLGDARVVLAVQPGIPGGPITQDQAVQATYAALLGDRRATVADPSTLLGGNAAPAVMRCQWWDDCQPDGNVRVRASTGGPLTEAGGQRFARVVVGAIP